MLSPEILKQINLIELNTKRILSGSLIGTTKSKQKGAGFEFDQIREYQPGDDIRFIDWKGSARSNKLLVRQYNEERSRTIMLVVDGSASTQFTSGQIRKFDVAAHVASILAMAAVHTNDAVGLVIFSDTVQHIIPPARGRNHALSIINALFSHTCAGTTNSVCALSHLIQLKRRDVMAFLISDFIQPNIDHSYKKYLRQAARATDLVAIECRDPQEQSFNVHALIDIQDLETGTTYAVDMHQVHTALNSFLNTRLKEQHRLFKQYAIDTLSLSPEQVHNQSYIPTLIKFFAQRMG